MLNLLLFLGSCALIAGFAWFFSRLGQGGLTAWIAILSLLANLFVLKQIDLLGLNATASDIFAIGNLLALNLLQEKYGRQATQNAIWTSFSCLLFFVIMSQIHLHYAPSIYDNSQNSYALILAATPRMMVASLFTFLLIDQFDSRFYRYARQKLPQVSMILVSAMTMCISQTLDSILCNTLGLYGVVEALIEIILVSVAIKVLAIASTIPWAYVSRKLFSQ